MSDDAFDRANALVKQMRLGATVRVSLVRTFNMKDFMDACRENDVMPEDLMARLILEGATAEVVDQ